MTKYQFNFLINGLHDVIPNKGQTINIDKVIFSSFGTYHTASIIVNGLDELDAEREAKYLINLTLSKIIFAYKTEATIDDTNHSYTDLDNEPNNQISTSSLTLRWTYADIDTNPQELLLKMNNINSKKKETLDLALSYYLLNQYFNPLRLHTLFSCLSVLVRDLLNKKKPFLSTDDLKKKIHDIMKLKNPKFDQVQFNDDWDKFYTTERNNEGHGRPSVLIDIRKEKEYFEMVDKATYWTRTVFQYFIESNQTN